MNLCTKCKTAFIFDDCLLATVFVQVILKDSGIHDSLLNNSDVALAKVLKKLHYQKCVQKIHC